MKKTNLKRFLLLFCMLACVFSMTACGNAQIDTNTAKESIKDNEVAYVENYLKAVSYTHLTLPTKRIV